MAIVWVGPNMRGLSSDCKPTNVPVNTQFWETDTGDTYQWSGSVWQNFVAGLADHDHSTTGQGGKLSGTASIVTIQGTDLTMEEVASL